MHEHQLQSNDSLETNYESLIKQGEEFMTIFHNNLLWNIVQSSQMAKESKRNKFLECSQLFSNWFQKTVLLRTVFEDELPFIKLAEDHLKDEYGHNHLLEKERLSTHKLWDPILEGISCWFAWKMFSLDSLEKIIHIRVLEAGASVAFPIIQKEISKYSSMTYFSLHCEVDEIHKNMGLDYLMSLPKDKYKRLHQVQAEAWSMMEAAMHRIAELINMTP